MFFYLSKFITALIWPSSVVVLLLIAGTLSILTGRLVRWGRRLLAVGAGLLILFGYSPLGYLMLLPLEQRFSRPVLPADLAGVIMLGGFENPAMTSVRGQLTLNDSAERLTETIAIAVQRPASKVIFTGGDATVIGAGYGSAAGPVGAYLAVVGIAPDRIVLEPDSRTTWENAVYLKRMLEPRRGMRFALVTSAFHMPRSVGTFRSQGFDVVPWPSDYRTLGWTDAFTFSTSVTGGLERVDLAFKEWIGLLVYWLSGRSDSVWPVASGEPLATKTAPSSLPAL